MEALDVRTGLTQEKLKRLFKYDKNTGLFYRLTCNNQHKIGEIGGYVTKEGYVRIEIYGHAYMAHRLAWFYIYGVWPNKRIDHKNKIRSDNKWENLREATDGQNSANCKVRSTNFLGVKGVRLHEGGKYVARICKDRKSQYLGVFDTVELATKAYMNKAKELFGEFATHESSSK